MSIFLTSQGTMVQSLVLLMILCLFLYATLKLKPFENRSATQLETVSLLALLTTVFCGIFYLSSRDNLYGFQVGKDCKRIINLLDVLSNSNKWILFVAITGSNGAFFYLFFILFIKNIRKKLRASHSRCFYLFCVCCSQTRLRREAQMEQILAKNEEMIL